MKKGLIIFIIIWSCFITCIVPIFIYGYFKEREDKRFREKIKHQQDLEYHSGFLKGDFEYEKS